MSIITKKEAEIIEEKKIECCEVEEKKVELVEEIKKLMSTTTKKDVEIIEGQKLGDINMLNLTKKELKVIARERGVKDYENLSKSRVIKEINKLKRSEGPKKTIFEKILSERYTKNMN